LAAWKFGSLATTKFPTKIFCRGLFRFYSLVRSETISSRGVKIAVRDFKVSAEMKYFQNEVYINGSEADGK